MEGFLAVKDAIPGIVLDFPDGPIPDTGQMPQPCLELRLLRVIEAQLQLPLDHLTPVSDSLCIA